MKSNSTSEKMKKYRRRKKIRKIKKIILPAVLILLLLLVGILLISMGRVKHEKRQQELKEQSTENQGASVEEVMESDFQDEEEKELENQETDIEVSEENQEIQDRALGILNDMTMEEKVYQLFIVTPEQLTGVGQVTQTGETSRNAIQKYPVGGIIYFAPNLISREQCTSMINDIQEASKIGLFIAVDEEGGTVARLGKNPAMGTTAFSSMGAIGETDNVQSAYEVGYTIGSEMKALGFNLDFAPVADVWSNPENKVIGSRAFGTDPHKVADMVKFCVEGFVESGTLCTLKHFPGHGDTEADSHYGTVNSLKTLEELRECELIPFQSGMEAGAPLVMVGHINLPNATEEDVPATFSYEVITELLRNELGFQGVVITDSMSMGAITEQYSSGEAATKAITAGIDIILMPKDLHGAVQGVLKSVEEGVLTEERINESVLRILELKLTHNIISRELSYK